jgi:hypothetical protein
MTELDPILTRLHADLGWKQLSPTWAKSEILFGLLSVAVGMVLLVGWAATSFGRPDKDWLGALAGPALIVLGGYLALAGHRSHIYQSNVRLTAYLISQIQGLQQKG